MKNSDAAFIIVGKVGATFGVHGWLKINTYTEFTSNILDYQPWYIQQNQAWLPVEIESGRMQVNGLIVKLKHIHTPEQARLLTGAEIAIKRDQLPTLKNNEYYWSDLIGLTVINQHGQVLGKVIFLMATGSNDVLIVKGDKEFAIPYLFGKVITQIDLTKQEIHVDWECL